MNTTHDNHSSHSSLFADIAKPLIAIMGPTASGKTQLACHLYDENPAGYDIISVDSALVYQDMNIGTAKPTAAELAKYPHALIDILPPTQTYSAADFTKDATALIKQCHAAGKTPILVGGTMLYFKALFGGVDTMPASQPAVRQKLTAQLHDVGIEALHARLQSIDPKTAQKLHKTDTQRILRALEVYDISGQPISAFHRNVQPTLPPSWQLISIQPERKELHKRIEKRLETMWEAGFLAEVQLLLAKYQLNDTMPAMRAVGYRQAFDFLLHTKQTKKDRQIMQDKALFATRQLAKRQYTWLRKFESLYLLKTFSSHSIAIKNLI